jgi:hypothetical protein
MTTANCDLYMNKLLEIDTLSKNVNGTKAQLETLLNELQTIDTNIENDIDVMPVPVTMVAMNKYVIVAVSRMRKLELNGMLYTLIKTRQQNVDIYLSTNTYDDYLLYTEETRNIIDYVENIVIPSCSCMDTRRFLNHKNIN